MTMLTQIILQLFFLMLGILSSHSLYQRCVEQMYLPCSVHNIDYKCTNSKICGKGSAGMVIPAISEHDNVTYAVKFATYNQALDGLHVINEINVIWRMSQISNYSIKMYAFTFCDHCHSSQIRKDTASRSLMKN